MYNKIDIGINDIGDLIISTRTDSDGNEITDISLVNEDYAVRQSVMFRLKTNLNELFMHPYIGNKLLEIIGHKNTRETAELGKRFLLDTIVKYNYINEQDVAIEAIPIDENTIIYTIQISDTPYSIINFVLELDLQDGVRRVIV